MRIKLLLPFSAILFFSIFVTDHLQAQVPNFTLTDIDGVEHDLYEDYLDQGKTVLLSFGAVWNPWDTVWVGSGVLQEFQEDYVSTGDAVVLFIDPFNSTADDFAGTTSNGLGYDFVEEANFPLISTGDDIIDDFEVQFFPSIRIICPDGAAFSDNFDSSNIFTADDALSYFNLETAEIVAEQMFEKCGTDFDLNAIEGTVYHDEDDNCTLDTNESTLANVTTTIAGPNGTVTRVTNQDGIFRRLAGAGNYTINVVPPNELWSACNSPVDVTFGTGATTTEFVEMGLTAEEDCPKLSANITAPFLRRCFDADLFVNYCNEGTVPADDVVVTVVLAEYMEYVSASITPTSVVGQTLTFDLGTLESWECGKITIVFFTNCDVELETEQCYNVEISPKYTCDDGRLLTEEECQEVRGAYDPNDKRAFPLSGSDEYIIEPNTTIKYQIRFQNTGNDTAFNIFIEDQLSEYLDVSTFRVGSASHNYEVEIDEDKLMVIRFPNIMLPDSNVNLVGSNGYINYYINQVPDLSNGVSIENTAGIFFDFNDPIITNTTRHIVDDGISSTTDLSEINFTFFPNPTSDLLHIRIDEEEWSTGTIEIFDVRGSLLVNQAMNQFTDKVDLQGLDSGMYILALTNEKGQTASKLLTVIK